MTQDDLKHDGEECAISYQRRDDNQKDIVDLGIALQQRSNTMSAVEYMRSQGVNHVIIERVLTEPGRRRSWSS